MREPPNERPGTRRSRGRGALEAQTSDPAVVWQKAIAFRCSGRHADLDLSPEDGTVVYLHLNSDKATGNLVGFCQQHGSGGGETEPRQESMAITRAR